MIDTHLLGEETGEPVILANLVMDKGDSHAAIDLNSRFSLITTIEPGLRPPTLSGIVGKDGGDTLPIIALHINLQGVQRVYQPV